MLTYNLIKKREKSYVRVILRFLWFLHCSSLFTHMFGRGLSVQREACCVENVCALHWTHLSIDTEHRVEKLNYHQLQTFPHSASDPQQKNGLHFCSLSGLPANRIIGVGFYGSRVGKREICFD